ncbi:UNVERIFIED_CONTAM: hypothetical protein FKN15_038484 [Acipenser sinensis]
MPHQGTVLAVLLCERSLSPVPLGPQGAMSADWKQEDILSIAASDEVGKQELAFPSEDVESDNTSSLVKLFLSAELLPLIKRATSVLQVPWPTEGETRQSIFDNDANCHNKQCWVSEVIFKHAYSAMSKPAANCPSSLKYWHNQLRLLPEEEFKSSKRLLIWVLTTVQIGYSLQFKLSPPPFRGVTLTSVTNPQDVVAVSQCPPPVSKPAANCPSSLKYWHNQLRLLPEEEFKSSKRLLIWVLTTVQIGYSLQFKLSPPPFRGVTLTSVTNPQDVVAVSQVVAALLQKLAI